MPNINSSSLKTLFDRFIKCATSSTSKASTSFNNEFSLLCATSFLQGQYHADITFSLHKLDKFSSFFSFSIKYISHLIFSVDIASSCMVFSSLDFLKWSLTASVLNRVMASLFHTLELLLDWSVSDILHNPQSIPFISIYVKLQITLSSHSDSSGSKIY